MSTATKAAGYGRLDIDAYRACVAGAVGIAASELTASRGDDQRLVLMRIVAAYFLLARDQMMPADIATLMEKGECVTRLTTSSAA